MDEIERYAESIVAGDDATIWIENAYDAVEKAITFTSRALKSAKLYGDFSSKDVKSLKKQLDLLNGVSSELDFLGSLSG